MLLFEGEEAAPRSDPARDEAVREMAAAMGYEFRPQKRKAREDELDNVPSSLSTSELDRLLSLACEPSDVEAPLLPFVLLKRTRRLLGSDGWKHREAIERHIAATEDPAELCAAAAALLYFPFSRPLSSPNRLEALRILLAERSRTMADYVNSMAPDAFYETRATVFERARRHEKPERVHDKFDFVRFIGKGANGAAFEVAPAAPPDARALHASRAALKVSRLEATALDVHAFLTRKLCGTPEAAFSKQRAYGIARLYYACDDCRLDVRKLPSASGPLGKWAEADRFSVSAMELCDYDLHGWSVLAPRQAVLEPFFSAILAQLLCTLDTLSRWNFIHGDLYLKNALLKRLPDYDGSELLHFADQRVHVPAHFCSGYVAKLADFGLSYAGERPDPKKRTGAFDVHTLACAWLSQIYCAVVARRMSLDEVPHRVVASLRAMVAPPEAFAADSAEWRAAFALKCDASTEPDFLKRHEGPSARPALARRVAVAANSLLRRDFDYSKGMTPAAALKTLPLLEQFRQASPQLSRGKIVPVNS